MLTICYPISVKGAVGYSVLLVAVTGSAAFFLDRIFRHPRRTGFTVLCFQRYGDCDPNTEDFKRESTIK